MTKKYLYFQPQYVSKFKCDGSKCDAHCCKGWNIFIDKDTFAQYSQLPQEITAHMKFHSEKGEYLVTLNKKRFCPFLNENNLCSIQLKYGEKFLSQTCATYPRVTSDFGYFFERSLALSCPVAAEMILFEREPMKFEFAEVPEKIHLISGKLFAQSIQTTEEFKKHIIEIQVAMISILQERTLTINQRLIMLEFFVDRLGEIFSSEVFDEDALTKLIAAYESKKFLAEQVPLMIRSVSFDAVKFLRLIIALLNAVYAGENAFESVQDKKFMGAFVDVFKLNPNENNFVSVSKVVGNYERFGKIRKNFLANYSTFLENYLVNEFFLSIYPWRFEGSLAQNIAAFITEYKLFELMTFAASIKGMDSKETLLEMVSWFITRFDHANEYKRRIFSFVADVNEQLSLMESLLEGNDD